MLIDMDYRRDRPLTLPEVLHLTEWTIALSKTASFATISWFPQGTGIFDREYLRAAGRAVEHPTRQATHLWMTALAGVVTEDVGQADYLSDNLKRHPATETPAGSTTGRVLAEGMQFSYLAERADDKVRVGVRRRRSHPFSPSL